MKHLQKEREDSNQNVGREKRHSIQKMTKVWQRGNKTIKNERTRRKNKGKRTTRAQHSKQNRDDASGNKSAGAGKKAMNMNMGKTNTMKNYYAEEPRETETERSGRRR